MERVMRGLPTRNCVPSLLFSFPGRTQREPAPRMIGRRSHHRATTKRLPRFYPRWIGAGWDFRLRLDPSELCGDLLHLLVAQGAI